MLPSHQDQNGGLRDDQVRLALECDFDRGFAKEQRVVPHLRLHREVLHLGAPPVDLPRLFVHAGGLRHRRAGPGGDDAPALHLPPFDRGSGQIEADVRALLALLGSDQDTVADDDQAFGVIRHTEMSSPVWPFCASRRLPVMPVTQPLLDLSGPVYNNVPAATRTPSYPVGGLRRCKRPSPTPCRPSSGASFFPSCSTG